MKIIKRNGSEVSFDISKIIKAIEDAANSVHDDFMEEEEIQALAKAIEEACSMLPRTPSVEEISDKVEDRLMDGHKKIAKAYITYRYKRMTARKANTTDDGILSLLERC